MKIAVAVCALDGVQSLFSGVGIVARSFIQQIDAIMAQALAGTDHTWTLSCATGALHDDAANLRPDLREATRAACARTGGSVRQLSSLADGTDAARLFVGQDPARCIDQWEALSAAAAGWLLDLAREHDLVLALLHDTPFAAVAGRLPGRDGPAGAQPGAARIVPAWVPHSLGVVFPDRLSAQRQKFEDRGIADLADRGGFVGYVSDYYREVLAGWDGEKKADLVPFLNVIDTAAYGPPSDLARRVLEGIPQDARLTFSWGRCKPQKGFDALLGAYRQVLAADPDGPDHLLLVAPTATSEPSYLEAVGDLARTLPGSRLTVVHDFDETLPLAALRDPRLDAVVLASRFEAFGLVAAEAQKFARPAARILYSPIPTFEAVLGGDPRAVRLAGVDAESVAAALLDRPEPAGAAALGKASEPDVPGAAFIRSQADGIRACLDRAGVR